MSMTRSFSIGAATIALTVLFATRCPALDIVVQPRVTGGVQDYQLTFPDVITPSLTTNGATSERPGFTIRDHLPYAGGGLTASSGRLFVDLSGQWSKTGETNSYIFQGNDLDEPYGYKGLGGHLHSLDSRFARQELNAAVGWALSPNFSAYLGYKSATLNMTQMRTPFLVPLPQDGDVLQDGNYNMDFSYHGFFLGTTYSLPVRTWGALSVQASIAQLDASFKQSFEGLLFIYTITNTKSGPVLGGILLNPSLENSRVSGSTNGLNVGVSWTGDFGWATPRLRRLSYTIGLDQSQYKFKADVVSDGDFEEKNTRVRLDVRYRFGGGGD
jgi:hypothetical protein